MKTAAGIVLLSTFLCPLLSFPISRWGNGSIVSPKIGFKASIPASVTDTIAKDDGKISLLLNAMPAADMPFFRQQSVDVAEILTLYPEFKGLKPIEIKKVLFTKSSNWKEKSWKPSAHLFVNSTDRDITVLAIWDANKGIVLTANLTNETQTAIQKILSSTEISITKE